MNALESERNHESDALENVRIMKERKKTLPAERKTSCCFLLRFILLRGIRKLFFLIRAPIIMTLDQHDS